MTGEAGASRSGRGLPVGLSIAAALLAALGASGFRAVFTPGATAAIVVPGALLGLAAGRVLVSAPTTPGRRAVVLVVAVVVAAAVGARSAAGLADVVDGPRRLVTGGVPADADGPSRAVATAVTCLGVALTVGLARRTRGAWSVGVATLLLLLSTATGLAGDPPPRGTAAGFVGAALAFLAVARATRARTGAAGAGQAARLRPLVAAGVAILVAVATSVVVTQSVTADGPSDRFTLRDVVTEVPEPVDARNPLDVAAGLRRRSDEILGTVRLDRSRRRLPLVSLVDYDGDTFVFTPRATPLGSRARSRSDEPVVTEHLELESWPFPVLPHIGEVVEVNEHPAAAEDLLSVDEQSGRVLSFGPSIGSWGITSVLGAEVAPTAGRYATGPDADRARQASDLPESFDPVLASAEDLKDAGGTRFVEDLAERFRAEFRVVEPGERAAAGHAVTTLACVVDGGFRTASSSREATACRRSGTPTQLAAAFVLVLRQLDVPARLVVGFELEGSSLGDTPLRTTDLTAWAEVPFHGLGWVPVDPVSDVAAQVSERSPEDSRAEDIAGRPEPPSSKGTGSEIGDVLTDAAGALDLRFAAGVVLVVPLVLLLAPAALRRRRAARRRSGSDEDRVRGAWWEMWDQLAERGAPAPSSAHVTEVVSLHAGGDEDETDTALADLVNRVSFGRARATTSEADGIWRAVEANERRWRGQVGVRRRLRRYVRYRPSRVSRRARLTRPGSSPPSPR